MSIQFHIKQQSIQNSKLRSILSNSFIQVMILVLKKYESTQQKNSFEKIKKVRLNPNKKQISKVQEIFLKKKILDILKELVVKKKKRYQKVRENYIKFNAYLALFSHWKKRKEIKKSCKIIFMWVKKQYCQQLFKAQISLKDCLFQQFAFETLRYNQKFRKAISDDKTVKQKQQILTQEVVNAVQPFVAIVTPQKEQRTPLKLSKPGMVAFFYGSSAKSQCDMAKYEI